MNQSHLPPFAIDSAFPTTILEALDRPTLKANVLTFHGNGSEYFNIWIVNLTLSVLTLGLLSPWASVRARRYFYENTELAGSRFEYHGSPGEILIGRGICWFSLLVLAVWVWKQAPFWQLALVAAVAMVPWLITNAMRFQSQMIAWRGVHFSWRGSNVQVYLQSTFYALVTLLTGGSGWFIACLGLERLFVDSLYFGNIKFLTGSFLRQFLKAYWYIFVATSFVYLLIGFAGRLPWPGMGDYTKLAVKALLTMVVSVISVELTIAQLSQILLNKTTLGPLELRDTTRWQTLLSLYTANTVLLVLTLGLYWPWARVREMQYRLSESAVMGDVERLHAINSPSKTGAALGQEAAGLMDFDIRI